MLPRWGELDASMDSHPAHSSTQQCANTAALTWKEMMMPRLGLLDTSIDSVCSPLRSAAVAARAGPAPRVAGPAPSQRASS